MVYYSTSAPIFPDSGKKNYSIQLRKQKSLCREQYPTEVKGEQKFTFWVYTLRCKLWRLGLPLGNHTAEGIPASGHPCRSVPLHAFLVFARFICRWRTFPIRPAGMKPAHHEESGTPRAAFMVHSASPFFHCSVSTLVIEDVENSRIAITRIEIPHWKHNSFLISLALFYMYFIFLFLCVIIKSSWGDRATMRIRNTNRKRVQAMLKEFYESFSHREGK